MTDPDTYDGRVYKKTRNIDTLWQLTFAFVSVFVVILLLGGMFFGFFAGLLFATGISSILLLGLNKTPVGHQYAVRLWENRTGEVITEGWHWRFPIVYTGEPIDARDRMIDVATKDFLSADNVPVKADVSSVYGLSNAAMKQRFQGDLDAHITNLTEEATRRYMLKHDAMAQGIFMGTGVTRLTPEQLDEQRSAVAQFKLEIESNGRERVQKEVDEEIKQYGAYCRRIVIENIRFPEDIEGAGGEELREMLESAGDDYDWRNTLQLAEQVKSLLGLTDEQWQALPIEQRMTFINENLDRAQAKKGQSQRFTMSGGSELTGAAAILKGGMKS